MKGGDKMRRLLELEELKVRDTLEDYMIVKKDRIENMLHCIENGARRIKELSVIIAEQQEEINKIKQLGWDE